MARRKTPRRASAPRGRATPSVPEVIYANASPRSVSGVSMFEAQHQITAETVEHFFSEPDVVERAAARLGEAGFQILQMTQATINIAGTRETYERAFKTRIVAEERPAIKEQGGSRRRRFWNAPTRRCSASSHLPAPPSRTSSKAWRSRCPATSWHRPRSRRSSRTGTCACPVTCRWPTTPIGPIVRASPERRQGRDGRQRPVQAPVLRQSRLPGRAGRAGSGRRQSAQRRGRSRYG